jgi:hypothetical protein
MWICKEASTETRREPAGGTGERVAEADQVLFVAEGVYRVHLGGGAGWYGAGQQGRCGQDGGDGG